MGDSSGLFAIGLLLAAFGAQSIWIVFRAVEQSGWQPVRAALGRYLAGVLVMLTLVGVIGLQWWPALTLVGLAQIALAIWLACSGDPMLEAASRVPFLGGGRLLPYRAGLYLEVLRGIAMGTLLVVVGLLSLP